MTRATGELSGLLQKGSSQSQKPKETLPLFKACSEPAKPVEAFAATTAKAPSEERNRCSLMPKKISKTRFQTSEDVPQSTLDTCHVVAAD